MSIFIISDYFQTNNCLNASTHSGLKLKCSVSGLVVSSSCDNEGSGSNACSVAGEARKCDGGGGEEGVVVSRFDEGICDEGEEEKSTEDVEGKKEIQKIKILEVSPSENICTI